MKKLPAPICVIDIPLFLVPEHLRVAAFNFIFLVTILLPFALIVAIFDWRGMKECLSRVSWVLPVSDFPVQDPVEAYNQYQIMKQNKTKDSTSPNYQALEPKTTTQVLGEKPPSVILHISQVRAAIADAANSLDKNILSTISSDVADVKRKLKEFTSMSIKHNPHVIQRVSNTDNRIEKTISSVANKIERLEKVFNMRIDRLEKDRLEKAVVEPNDSSKSSPPNDEEVQQTSPLVSVSKKWSKPFSRKKNKSVI
mmetsp:Transcript_12167/g.21110  ORF Transcript_12167/g.21110 Transcript_12167/m.21110 type:complete len:254 (-) Transcript_12167:413-1174(-)